MSQQEEGRKNVQVTTAAAAAARMWPEQRVTSPQGRRNASTTRRAHNQQGSVGAWCMPRCTCRRKRENDFSSFRQQFCCYLQFMQKSNVDLWPATAGSLPQHTQHLWQCEGEEGQTYIDLVRSLPRSKGVHFMHLPGGIPWKGSLYSSKLCFGLCLYRVLTSSALPLTAAACCFLSAAILNLLLCLLFRIQVEARVRVRVRVVCHLHNNWPHECGQANEGEGEEEGRK